MRNGQAVDEVVRIDEVAGPPHVEDDGYAGLLRLGPHAEQVTMTG